MLRTGVNKRWSKKFLLQVCANSVFYPVERQEEYEGLDQRSEAEVVGYAAGLSDSPWDAQWFGLRLLRLAVYRAFKSGALDPDALALGLAYRLRTQQIWHARELSILRANEEAGFRGDLAGTTEDICAAFSVGWTREASFLADTALLLLPRRAYGTADPQLDLQYEPYRMCFGRFVLQLYADYAGRQMPEPMPRHPYESPAYDQLLKCWRHPDPAALVESLLTVCDWHTHESIPSRSMKPSKRKDFLLEVYMGWPVAVHMVYRLRQQLGLAIPEVLDHPLMQTPLATYLPPLPVPEDGVLGRFTDRAIQQFPLLPEFL